MPGSAALNTGGDTVVTAVSCPTAGNCAAGGSTVDYAHGNFQAFIVSDRNGAWGKAIEVRGPASDENPVFNSVSCSSAGTARLAGRTTSPTPQMGQALRSWLVSIRHRLG